MPQISLRNISFTYSGDPLLDDISIEIEQGERIGLVGRNGAGKSTLMKIVVGEITPDNGEVWTAQGLTVTRLVQEVPDGTAGTITEIVRAGLGEEVEDWEADTAVETVLTRMALNGEAIFGSLSSGMKRRALLARALVREPDILLLDEPTNHLDIDSITWLERFLKGYNGTLLFVTHDRVFLQALATRIIEVDRGKLFDWTCDYQTFLKRKQELLHAEDKANEHFDRKLAEEEKWIRKGIKARRTRNEGRVRELKRMRQERAERRGRVGNVSMTAATADKSGRMVIEAKDVGFAYDTAPIVQGLTSTIMRGDKIGIIGPNGAGKSTLLKLLLGDLKPKTGTIRHGTKLEVIYFDQLREQIDEEKTVVENVSEGQDMLELNGSQIHIYGYLQNFLFTPERARRPARFLSGGERNRLLLARLFKKPSNLMVLDEPTNDLDAETLELLEELVAAYTGTLLLVSHDRAFINNVVTSTLVFEGGGAVHDYDGGYDDYIRQRDAASPPSSNETKKRVPKTMSVEAKPEPKAEPKKKKKLGFKEQRELDELPDRIEQLETEQSELNKKMAEPEFYKQDAATITTATTRAAEIEEELLHCLERWEELGG
jgi:ATP-binding cassette subfamily F protein uup